MNEQLLTLVRFCRAESSALGRFFEIEYIPLEGAPNWEVSVFLGYGYTCPGAKRYSIDHWLVVKGDSMQEVLNSTVQRLGTVRKRKVAA